MREEQLRRGQAPFLLPVQVMVRGEASPAALAALAKRTLYPPARWPEEMNDGLTASGPMTVSFGGSLPSGGDAVLFGRVRTRRGKVPMDVQHGPVILLGHSAQAGGWQPFALPLAQPLVPEMTVEVNLNAPLSRLLLGRGLKELTWNIPLLSF